MHGAYAVALVALCAMNAVVWAKLGSPGGPLKLQRDMIDSFEAFSNFPYSVAISDSDNDTMFECVVAKRTEIDPVDRTATFVWHFVETDHSPEQDVPFYAWSGTSPGTMEVVVGDDPTVLEGVFYYSSKDCVVMDLEYHRHQCLLWTHWQFKDSAPRHCIDHFVDTCGVVPPAHSRDLCPDGEGGY